MPRKNSAAFIGASWAALFIGAVTYLVVLWNGPMQLNEKGYYFTLLMYGLFSAVSLQKSVRDRLDEIFAPEDAIVPRHLGDEMGMFVEAIKAASPVPSGDRS